MPSNCHICGKELSEGEGFISNVDASGKQAKTPKEAVAVCSKACQTEFQRKLNNNGRPMMHYSRITGYMQLVDNWNNGKRQELKDRHRITV